MGEATRHISPARRVIPGLSSELSVIIPCAGLSRRMKGYGPKPLLEVNGVSIIERQLHTIWRLYPKADILVPVGFQADKFRKQLQQYPVRLIYNPLFETTNVAFSISLGLQASISHNVLIVYGDLVFNEDAISHITNGHSKVLVDNSFREDEVGLVESGGMVTNFAYGLPQKWGQIAYLTGGELELFKAICYNEGSSKWFGYEVLNEVINQDGKIESHRVRTAKVTEIDTPQDVEAAIKVAD